ncbi:hypothetical protein BKA80DRAFT_269809 [Phyllosticta citrichinensis]
MDGSSICVYQSKGCPVKRFHGLCGLDQLELERWIPQGCSGFEAELGQFCHGHGSQCCRVEGLRVPSEAQLVYVWLQWGSEHCGRGASGQVRATMSQHLVGGFVAGGCGGLETWTWMTKASIGRSSTAWHWQLLAWRLFLVPSTTAASRCFDAPLLRSISSLRSARCPIVDFSLSRRLPNCLASSPKLALKRVTRRIRAPRLACTGHLPTPSPHNLCAALARRNTAPRPSAPQRPASPPSKTPSSASLLAARL